MWSDTVFLIPIFNSIGFIRNSQNIELTGIRMLQDPKKMQVSGGKNAMMVAG